MGETYEREEWERGYRSTDDPMFRKINPVRVVPVIDDGGFRLRESNTIVRYLAVKHGRADLYPTDLQARARTESSMDWASTDFANGMRPVFHGLVVMNPAYANMVADGIRDRSAQMRMLEEHLTAGGPYVLGAAFGIGDIPVGLVVNRWFAIAFDTREFEAISDDYDRLTERPGYRAHGRNGTP
jgi:glutathione S-transferase